MKAPLFADVRGLADENIDKLTYATDKKHNIFLVGSPGAGKTMIARRIAEASGGPFRAPHYTISTLGMRGGICGNALHLGEIGRSHGGTLFLDEAPEFSRRVLDDVVHAFNEGYFTTAVGGKPFNVYYPQGARGFRLIVASNPCPCGYSGHAIRRCQCKDTEINDYVNRIESLRELCQTQVRL